MKDDNLYRVVSTHNGQWWPRNRKSLSSWLGKWGARREVRAGFYVIERAVITEWVDVTEEFS